MLIAFTIPILPEGDPRLIYTVLSVTSVCILCLLLIKKAKNALCPKCGSDLYNIIDAAKNNKTSVCYCPSCGANIKI